jgi:hypothetical protein
LTNAGFQQRQDKVPVRVHLFLKHGRLFSSTVSTSNTTPIHRLPPCLRLSFSVHSSLRRNRTPFESSPTSSSHGL